MKIPINKILNYSLISLTVSFFLIIIPVLASRFLPDNKITHECVSAGASTQKNANTLDEHEKYQLSKLKDHRAFCEVNHYAQFKQSWTRIFNNIGFPLAIISILAIIPSSSILILRKISKFLE